MLEILGVPFSAHTRKVIVAARFKGIPFELIPTIPLDPPPGFDALSPLGKIPVIRDGAITLADSTVIALYLDRRFPERPLYPSEPRAYGRALWIEELVDGELAGHVLHGLLFQRVFGPRFLGLQPDQRLIEETLGTHVPRRLAYLEEVLADAWFAGEALSYADVTVASILLNYHYAGEALDRARYPRLHGFLRRALRHPSFAAALEVEAPAAREVPGLDLRLLEELGYRAP